MDPSTTDWITAGGTVIAAFGTVGALIFAARAAKAASASADAAGTSAEEAKRAIAAEDERRQRADLQAIRGSVRLLHDLFQTVSLVLDSTLESRQWSQLDVDFSVWDTQAVVLSRLVEESEWEALSQGIIAARNFSFLSQGRSGETRDYVRTALENYAKDLKVAREVLLHYQTTAFLLLDKPAST
jgi:hypothetical protein